MTIIVQQAPFDAAKLLAGFAKDSDAGAQVTFTGIVRADDGLQSLEIEHYPAMTEKALTQIADEAKARWELADCLIIHRFGKLTVGEHIMMVATASKHRAHAFEAAEFPMDYLKFRAPFWKKEHHDTTERWVEAKSSDEAALDRWAD